MRPQPLAHHVNRKEEEKKKEEHECPKKGGRRRKCIAQKERFADKQGFQSKLNRPESFQSELIRAHIALYNTVQVQVRRKLPEAAPANIMLTKILHIGSLTDELRYLPFDIELLVRFEIATCQFDFDALEHFEGSFILYLLVLG